MFIIEKRTTKQNLHPGRSQQKNIHYFCHSCREIVQLHRRPPVRCGQCSEGYIEKVDKSLLQVGQQQSEERIIQPAFDRTDQTNPSLLVNQFGVIVTANEVENKAQLTISKIKTQFPSREATSDITDPQCSICLENYILKQHISIFSKEKPSQVVTLPCNHTFHAECIYQWLPKEPSCPTCRYPVGK